MGEPPPGTGRAAWADASRLWPSPGSRGRPPARPDPGHRDHDRRLLRGLDALPDRGHHPRHWRHAHQRRSDIADGSRSAHGTGEITAIVKLCRTIRRAPRWSLSTRSPPTGSPRSCAGCAGAPTATSATPARSAPSSRASSGPAAGRCCWPRTRMNSPGHQASRRPADHAGRAQAHPAPDPDVADPLHGLDEHAVTSPPTGVSSPVVSTFPADPAERNAARARGAARAGTARAGPHVSIVLPCFNEEEHVVLEVERICTAMDTSGLAYELIAVDDGSTDADAGPAAARRTPISAPAGGPVPPQRRCRYRAPHRYPAGPG